jgi:hypothetical protein
VLSRVRESEGKFNQVSEQPAGCMRAGLLRVVEGFRSSVVVDRERMKSNGSATLNILPRFLGALVRTVNVTVKRAVHWEIPQAARLHRTRRET